MKRKNMTRNALITSIISILLCVSMLVGATFAWFTDEVVTGMNTIAAGNLDIELYANGAKVDAATKLFDDVELWEPGVVTYENLEIKNVGTLALKYQMTMNFEDENDLNGHKLSEVVKVAVLEKPIAAGASREEVLALAQAAVEKDNGMGTLANFYVGDSLLPGEGSGEQAVVIFWAPNANEIDNLYNANNGQQTSDGKPLSIKFGINLQATQLMYEEDSFGSDYDKDAGILPQAAVNGLPGKTLDVVWGIGGAEGTLEAPFIMQFQPNESYDEAQASQYGKWHADFVVKADRDVASGSMALGGFYNAWCEMIKYRWVALRNDDLAVAAGEEIRLVSGMADGLSVNYEEICKYGNDGTGFLCTAADLDGTNAGTTLTVELRLYEVEKPSEANGNSWNVETGKYVVVGTYTYTFGMAEQEGVTFVRSAAELQAAVDNAENGAVIAFAADITGDVVVTQKAGTSITINGCDKKFNGVMTVFGNGNQAGEEALTIKDVAFVAAEGAESCIVSPDRVVNNKYSYAHNVTIEGCTFTDPDGAVNCAAVRTQDGGDKNWTVKDCTVDNTMHSLLQVQNIEGKLTVTGCTVKSKNGANLNSTTNLEMTGCTFDVKGYAVRFGVNSGGDLAAAKNFVLTNNTLKSAGNDGDAVIIIRASAANAVLTLNNTTLVGAPEISGATDATTIVR